MCASLFGSLASSIEDRGWLCRLKLPRAPGLLFLSSKIWLEIWISRDCPCITRIFHFIFGIKDSLSYVLHTANSLIIFDDAITSLSRALTILSRTYSPARSTSCRRRQLHMHHLNWKKLPSCAKFECRCSRRREPACSWGPVKEW